MSLSCLRYCNVDNDFDSLTLLKLIHDVCNHHKYVYHRVNVLDSVVWAKKKNGKIPTTTTTKWKTSSAFGLTKLKKKKWIWRSATNAKCLQRDRTWRANKDENEERTKTHQKEVNEKQMKEENKKKTSKKQMRETNITKIVWLLSWSSCILVVRSIGWK